MATIKTYLLAPNFTYQSDGPIRLGNIIADPFKPTKPLSTLDLSLPFPDVVVTTELDRTIDQTEDHSRQLSVWAQFLQSASGNVGLDISGGVSTQYTMDCLETTYFKTDPTDEEVEKRVQSNKVKAAINSGLFGRQPVYMITGLKIAKGFSMNKEVRRKREGNIGASLPTTDQVSLGANIGLSKGTATQESFRMGNDIIFAYQLHVIATKGWREKRVEVDAYAPKSALLHSGDQQEKETMIASVSTKADLREISTCGGDLSLDVTEVPDGDETCICISFKES